MNKYIVISDSHGDDQILTECMNRYPDIMMLHCGDSELSDQHPIFQHLQGVAGNCDFESDVKPSERLIVHHGDRIFMTHGHRYQVKQSPLALSMAAQEKGATIALFGHSHVPYVDYNAERDLLLLNPGSITLPRIFPQVRTYVLLETSDDEYRVHWYNHEHEWLKTLRFKRGVNVEAE